MAFTNFVCLFLVVRSRAGGAHGRAHWRTGRQAAEADGGGPAGRQTAKPGAGQRRPACEHKNAVGRRECTGPQPFGQNTSLNPNSAQLK